MFLQGRLALLLVSIPCYLRGVAAAVASVPSATCYAEEFWRKQSWADYSGAFERCGPDLVCRKDHAECEKYCNIDDECEGFPLRVCDRKTFKCRHDSLLKGSAGADVGAAVLFFIISGLALSAGIGGGGLYVPLLMAILGFTVREATGLSQACLSGGASTALVYNLRQRHPLGKKPMIDYTLVLVMGPNLLIGALVGSTLNASAPSWLILGLLMLVLCQSVLKTFKKAIATFRKEKVGEVRGMPASGDARLSMNPVDRCIRFVTGRSHKQFHDSEPGVVIGQPVDGFSAAPAAAGAGGVGAAQAGAGEAAAGHVVGKPVADGGEMREKAAAGHALDLDLTVPRSPTGESVASASRVGVELNEDELDRQATDRQLTKAAAAQPAAVAGEQRQYPRRKLLGFGAIWMITVACILARGGKGSAGLVPFCSAWYWLVALATIMVLACISAQAAKRAVAEGRARPERAPEVEGELQWTPRAAMSVTMWSLLAGTLAALCGIGGGMVMGPILLDLGFLPQVQSATTATTLFVMSTSTCLAFLVAGAVPVDYVFWLAAATGAGAIFGKAIVGYFVKKLRRPSIIMFLLGGIIAASVVVMGTTGAIDIVNDIRNGEDMLFKGFCDESDS